MHAASTMRDQSRCNRSVKRPRTRPPGDHLDAGRGLTSRRRSDHRAAKPAISDLGRGGGGPTVDLVGTPRVRLGPRLRIQVRAKGAAIRGNRNLVRVGEEARFILDTRLANRVSVGERVSGD